MVEPAATDAANGSARRYHAALDGLRAIAVTAVLLYHGGAAIAPAGYLGVDLFFVLSGFLITTLLVDEYGRGTGIDLVAFWGRRARRLLPALSMVVAFVAMLAAWAFAAGTFHHLRADALSALLYVANWQFIAQGANYFAATAMPSPLTHTWSLAIEEQFYVLWPLLVLAALALRGRVLLGGVALLVTVGSSVEMALGSALGWSSTRLYYGTDTHAMGLALGALLAVVVAHGLPTWMRRPRLLGAAGLLGLLGWATMVTTIHGDPTSMYRGGFVLVSVLAVLLVAAAWLPGPRRLQSALSWAPLVALGKVSYGLYLWHYPIYLWLSPTRTGLSGAALLVLRITVSLAAAIPSYLFVERVVREAPWFRGSRGTAAIVVAMALAFAAVVIATAASA